MLSILLVGLLGCGSEPEIANRDDVAGISPNQGQDTTQVLANFDLSASWSSEEVTIEIFGGQGEEFWCGIAETGCGSEDTCWVGESCVGSQYCHDCGRTGVVLSLGGDPNDLEEGAETAFEDSSYRHGVTYYVEKQSTNECWVFGHDPYYYIVDLLETQCTIWTSPS